MPAKHASLLYTKCLYLSTRFFQIFLITGHDLPFSPVFSRFLVLALKKLKNNSKYADVEKAVNAGATNLTHTYNAMKPVHHREVGTVGSAYLFDQLACECICDGIHVSRPAIKLLHKNNL